VRLAHCRRLQYWKGTLPKTGDYEIMVFPEDEATNTTFTLELAIR